MTYAPLKGVDVSHYQTIGTERPIDWEAVAADGYSFAYLRLARGLYGSGDEVDEDTQYNMRGAAKAGVLFGLYHRVNTVSGSPVAHARWALRLYHSHIKAGCPEPQLAFACDYEEQKTGGGVWVAEYLDVLRDALGERRMVLYSSGSYFGKFIEPSGYSEEQTKLWIAHTEEWPYVGGDPANPSAKALLPGRPKFRDPQECIHQWSHKGTVKGIDGAVDLNQAMGPLPTRV